MNLFLVAFATVFFSFCITGITRRYAIINNLVDTPNKRSSHKIPTPSGGGTGIVFSFLSVVVWLSLIGEVPFSLFSAVVSGGSMVAIVGLLDDHKHVPAIFRLLIHFLAVGSSFYFINNVSFCSFGGKAFPIGWINNIIEICLFVWLLNLFNFMDGIDGIAGIESIFVLSGAAVISVLINGSSIESFLLIVLASGCCGFLFWNWPPAKIFMGDIGSGFLGYLIGLFVLQTVSSGLLTLWVWFILLGVFLVDASMTLLVRVLRFERVYEAHCSHAYQKAARRYGSHKQVTITVFLINLLWLFPLALGAAIRPDMGRIITLIAFVPLILLALKFGAGMKD